MKRVGTNLAMMQRSAALFAAAMLAGAGPAAADGLTTVVSGDSFPSECGKAKQPSFSTELTGDLTGCMAIFVEHLNCREMNGFAFTTELGREEFEGELKGEPIKFDTQYAFEATWPTGSCPEPAVEQEITGGCVHRISGDGVVGLIRFYDVMPVVGKGGTHFFYEGSLTLG